MQPVTRTTRPVIRGQRYAVSSRKPQATQAAEQVLRDGGNAFDAAAAGVAVLMITDPAMTGLGGDAAVLVYPARERKVVSINAAGKAPRMATMEWFETHAGGKIPVNEGVLAASTPTVLDALLAMLERWGTMPLEPLFAPAIELAERGFAVSEYLAEYIEFQAEKLRRYPSSAAIYFPEGRALRAGDILRNPDLASTLRMIVEVERSGGLRAARDRFYRGDIARAMADFFERHGGLYRYEDFAEYSVEFEEPVSIEYRGCRIYKNASANQGPTELILLNLLEPCDLAGLEHNSADFIHVCVEAAKLAYADREKYLGDASFTPIPFDVLLSKDYARRRSSYIDRAHARLDLRPGSAVNLTGAADHAGDTSYMAVVDQQGNAVSFTPSLHSAFGTGVVIDGLGFIPNCRGDFYHLTPGHPNALAPRKRPRTTLTPTIVLKDGAPFLVMGSPGGDDQPMRIAQTFINIVDFGMNVQEAIEAPRWSTTSFPASEFPHTMYPGHMSVEDRIPENVRAELHSRGHIVETAGPWTLNATCAILCDRRRGVLEAGADPRGDSYALAW